MGLSNTEKTDSLPSGQNHQQNFGDRLGAYAEQKAPIMSSIAHAFFGGPQPNQPTNPQSNQPVNPQADTYKLPAVYAPVANLAPLPNMPDYNTPFQPVGIPQLPKSGNSRAMLMSSIANAFFGSPQPNQSANPQAGSMGG